VFAAYKRRWDRLPRPELAATPTTLPPLPREMTPGEIRKVASDVPLPPPGEAAALAQLDEFLQGGEANYARARDFPAARPGTSRLSYYCNIGALSPRLAVQRARTPKWGFELAWWDFFAEVLDRQPESVGEEYRAEWRGFPWRSDVKDVEAWKMGRTGFPIVDAGMRALRQTGFLHNRVRLITASFLTKHLLTDWRIGEVIFRGWLLCGDTAQNVGNWQWVAGCGVDPAPYFRVFNPVTQGERYDPDGDYVRRWVPELADLPARLIHRPWEAETPPKNYPAPMLDLAFGRKRFLDTAQTFLGDKKP
jgi:deoxyribodipyrimidine photo-lyase